MTLLDSEVLEIQKELGYNLLDTGAEFYVSTVMFFKQIVATYLTDEVTTTVTLSTPIAATTTPAPQTLTLASATGFAVPARCIIDVDSREEEATLQSLTGSDATFLLTKAHSGTFPVSVSNPVSMTRSILAKIRNVKAQMSDTYGTGALKKVDEIEFYNSSKGQTLFGNYGDELKRWRCELSAITGAPSLWESICSGSGSSMVLY